MIISRFSLCCLVLSAVFIAAGFIFFESWLAVFFVFIGFGLGGFAPKYDVYMRSKPGYSARSLRAAQAFAAKYPQYIARAKETATWKFSPPKILPEATGSCVPEWVWAIVAANQTMELAKGNF